VLEADQHFLEEGVVDVRMLVTREQHDADQLRLLLDERAGGGAGRVVEPAATSITRSRVAGLTSS
jgi:hypothetical protein